MGDLRNRHLVSHADCLIISVDYRLGPETPHPGPVEDCYAALKWLYANAEPLGVIRNRIAVGGESAGGGLSAALALLARDRGEVPVIFQMLAAPLLDDRTCIRKDTHPYAGEFIWTAETNYLGWKALLGCEPGSPGVSPYAAAARAENLAGLPPTFISVGALDLLFEENLEYARRLARAGVPVELHVYPGALHGFELVADSHLAKEALRTNLTALRRALHPGVALSCFP
jgi:acetyl esterase/lipase